MTTARSKSLALVAIAAGASLQAAQGVPMLQFNEKKFTLTHSFPFKMKVPDFAAMTDADRRAGKLKWKESQAIALSDKPFDAAALQKLDSPLEALDEMAKKGAAVVIAAAASPGTASMVRVALPGAETIVEPDNTAASLTFNPPQGGKVTGKLVLKGDRKMHEFDPAHVPFIEIDASF